MDLVMLGNAIKLQHVFTKCFMSGYVRCSTRGYIKCCRVLSIRSSDTSPANKELFFFPEVEANIALGMCLKIPHPCLFVNWAFTSTEASRNPSCT